MNQGLAAPEVRFFHVAILGFAALAAGVVYQPARPAAPSKAPAPLAPSRAAVPAAKALARPKTEEDRIELELLGRSSKICCDRQRC